MIWIVVGAIIGWLASIITGRNQQQGFLIDIVVGIVGAFLGGLGYNLITGQGLTPEQWCGHHQRGWFCGGSDRRSGAAASCQLVHP